jgi:hypothetical protein
MKAKWVALFRLLCFQIPNTIITSMDTIFFCNEGISDIRLIIEPLLTEEVKHLQRCQAIQETLED